jgi:hypothetical protein
VGAPPWRAGLGAADRHELARLWRRQGKTTQARKLLSSVYRRFTEGFDTADLVTAKTLLQSLK